MPKLRKMGYDDGNVWALGFIRCKVNKCNREDRFRGKGEKSEERSLCIFHGGLKGQGVVCSINTVGKLSKTITKA